MNLHGLKESGRFIFLLVISISLMQFVWYVYKKDLNQSFHPEEKINLALRRTAHLLLKEAGDSSSQIAPVQKVQTDAWMIRLAHSFNYDRLPEILQESFKLHQIQSNYNVSILRCADGTVKLGYNFFDVSNGKGVPCSGRELDSDCYDLHVRLLAESGNANKLPILGWLFSGLLAVSLYGLGLIWIRKSPKSDPTQHPENQWIQIANSQLDVSNQILISGTESHKLTYRETKLLHLFVQHPNQILERQTILKTIWEDEGILVGRSLDMFVSRLRKVLRKDPLIQLVAIHGVGYRLEIGSKQQV